ncbi:MAG TPA: DUF1214 domain-containing protein [Mycobacterium sp.]|nr:DUF1214 domain-containing protein [Mycobacterium sp.]
MAATVATGAVAMAAMAPQVAVTDSVLSKPVRLLTSSDPLQSVIDQLQVAQQQMQVDMSQYPFVTSADLPMAHEYAQNALTTMLAASVAAFNYLDLNNVAVPFAPYAWNATATNMQQLLVYANPDDQYTALPLLAGNTYTMTITPPAGPTGTGDVTFVFVSGDGVTAPYQSIASYNLNDATPNADGSYTLTFSDTPQPDATNWIDIPADADRTIIRDSVSNWGLPHDSFAITEEGVAPPSPTHPPLLTDDQIVSLLGPIAANATREVASPDYLGQLDVTNSPAANTVSDIQPTHGFMPGPLLTGNNQWLSAGDYSLQPDQALIIKVPEVAGAYASAMLANIYGQSAPAATATGNLNPGDTFHDPDGFTYYVISSQDPGVANWLNNNGAADGGIWLRFQGLQTIPANPIPVTTQVVNVTDVQQYLPADTPTVSPAEEAAAAQLRLFEWDYTHDQNENVAWVGANLEYDQIKAAVGAQAFGQLFGGQSTQYGAPQSVPTVLDRMVDPSLVPHLATLIKDIVADPHGAMAAIKDNLHIAVTDVEMPTVLAALRLEVLVEQTAQSVKGAISSGQWSQALSDLVKGLGGLGTVLNEITTDPGTSITAGLLNARDDLAVSIMNASSYATASSGSASVPESLSQLAQSVSQALDPNTAWTDFSALSSEVTAQIATAGADVAPTVAGMPLDLLP